MTGHSTVEITLGGPVDDVEPLWRALHAHHAPLGAGVAPVRDQDASWRRRRAQYEAWLAGGDAALLVARDGAGSAVGYAMLTVGDGGMATWDVGERVAELETLSVAPGARGEGVGAALMEAARAAARECGAGALLVGVLATNARARRFYEREGLRPFYEQMLARL